FVAVDVEGKGCPFLLFGDCAMEPDHEAASIIHPKLSFSLLRVIPDRLAMAYKSCYFISYIIHIDVLYYWNIDRGIRIPCHNEIGASPGRITIWNENTFGCQWA